MFNISIGKTNCRISLLFPAVLLFWMWMDSTGLASFGFLAAVQHEIGHLAALLLCGGIPAELTLSFFGMQMSVQDDPTLRSFKKAAVIAAGPAVNLVAAGCLFVCKVPDVYGMIHLLLGAFNLLPMMPLDGGQLFKLLLERHFDPTRCDRILRLVGIVLLLLVTAFGIALCMYTGNFTLLLVAGYLAMLTLQ